MSCLLRVLDLSRLFVGRNLFPHGIWWLSAADDASSATHNIFCAKVFSLATFHKKQIWFSLSLLAVNDFIILQSSDSVEENITFAAIFTKKKFHKPVLWPKFSRDFSLLFCEGKMSL